MAYMLKRDTMDFEAYLQGTEHVTRVRRASEFFDDVRRQFEQKDSGKRHAGMSSTKAGDSLEFLPGNVTCWAGFNGHKKSMLTSQVALDLCSAGERVLMASMEMTPAETLARMARQAAASNRPHDSWLAAFQDWTDDRLWIFDKMGRVKPSEILGLCQFFANDLKGNHVFIDSMMMVLGSEESMDEQKQFMTDLVRIAQETKLHIHLVAHCRKPPTTGETLPPNRYDIKGTSAISDQASNVVMVWFNKAKRDAIRANPQDLTQGEKPDAVLVIDKQRHGTFEGKLTLWFDDRSLRFCDTRTAPVEAYDLWEAA